MARRSLALCVSSLFLLAPGCAGEDQANPPSGTWTYRDGGVVMNTCGTEDLYRDPNTMFTLVNNGDGSFTVDQGNEEDFDCNIDGMSFECPYRLGGTETNADVMATVSWELRVDGTFSSDTQMSGTQTVEFTCSGNGCALAPALGWTLPCTYEVAFDAEKN